MLYTHFLNNFFAKGHNIIIVFPHHISVLIPSNLFPILDRAIKVPICNCIHSHVTQYYITIHLHHHNPIPKSSLVSLVNFEISSSDNQLNTNLIFNIQMQWVIMGTFTL